MDSKTDRKTDPISMKFLPQLKITLLMCLYEFKLSSSVTLLRIGFRVIKNTVFDDFWLFFLSVVSINDVKTDPICIKFWILFSLHMQKCLSKIQLASLDAKNLAFRNVSWIQAKMQ